MLILISIFHLSAGSSKQTRGELAGTAALLNKQISLTVCPKNREGAIVLITSRPGLRDGTLARNLALKRRVIIGSLALFSQSPLSLCFVTALFIGVLHCSPSHVYWPKLQCEIQNNCTPLLPRHSPRTPGCSTPLRSGRPTVTHISRGGRNLKGYKKNWINCN